MKNLEKVISDYLAKPSDYAIQIVGNWGNGKTYFYKNTLESLINNQPTYNDNDKKYKLIYISLFGLKSTEDIATKIVFDFFQSTFFNTYFTDPVKKKKLKITQSILKITLQGFLNFSKLGNAKDYLMEIGNIGQNVLDTNELVVCFDDIERKDSKLNINDLTGYINSLVDAGIKVLMISNEDLLMRNGDDYKNLKEKIIGISMEFIPDTRAAIQNIIAIRYSGFAKYSEFLNDHLDLLMIFCKAVENNFRHLIYALDSLQNCYSLLNKDILDINHEISKKLKKEIVNISILTLAFSAEYKSSNLKYSDADEYRDDYGYLSDLITELARESDKQEKIEPSKVEILRKKYSIDKENYFFFDSIFNFVTGSDEFQTTKFIEEFIKKFNLEKGYVSPQYEIFNSLGYQNFYNLSDSEYRDNTIKLIDYAKDGLFTAPDYLSIMHFVERFDNVLGLDLKEVSGQILIGLEKSLSNEKLNNELTFSQFQMSGRMSEISEINKVVYEKGMELIRAFREKKSKDKVEKDVLFLINDFAEFQTKYKNDIEYNQYVNSNALLNNMDLEKFRDFFIGADKETLFFFKYFFEERYKHVGMLRDEYASLKRFYDLLIGYSEKEVKGAPKSVRNYLFNELVDSLRRLLQHTGK